MSNDDSTKIAVWKKGIPVENYDENKYRKDRCGAWIVFSAHGNTISPYGWQIHHVIAKSKGGPNVISNLIPLQWKNNLVTADNEQITCAVKSSGNKNILL